MTIEQNKYFVEGRSYYTHILKRWPKNAISPLRPTKHQIHEVARELDLKTSYVEKCVDIFLNN